MMPHYGRRQPGFNLIIDDTPTTYFIQYVAGVLIYYASWREIKSATANVSTLKAWLMNQGEMIKWWRDFEAQMASIKSRKEWKTSLETK